MPRLDFNRFLRSQQFAKNVFLKSARSSQSPKNRFMPRATSPLVMLGMLAMAIPSPAIAFNWSNIESNEYRVCAARLLTTGIVPEIAAISCARALHPKDLGGCVLSIHRKTDITAQDALLTCREVQRPLDLATCVVDISRKTQRADPPVVLDTCRRSLLPIRFSECVVGLSRKIELTPNQAMAACIDGSDRPHDFYPPLPPSNQSVVPPGPDLVVPPGTVRP